MEIASIAIIFGTASLVRVGRIGETSKGSSGNGRTASGLTKASAVIGRSSCLCGFRGLQPRNRAFVDRQIQQPREGPEADRNPPHQIVGAGDVEDPPAQPHAEKRTE